MTIPAPRLTPHGVIRAVLVVLTVSGLLWMHALSTAHGMSSMSTAASSGQAATERGSMDAMLVPPVADATAAVAVAVAVGATVAHGVPAETDPSMGGLCLAVASAWLAVVAFVVLLTAVIPRRVELLAASRRAELWRRRPRALRAIGLPSLVMLGISRT